MYPGVGVGSLNSLVTKFSSMVVKGPVSHDDSVDRLHYFYTVVILFVCAVVVGLEEYVGTPINCMAPKEYSEQTYHAHINSYCWTHPLRHTHFTRGTGFFELKPRMALIDFGTAFFRWAIVLIVAQIVLFKLPIFLWRRLCTTSGNDLGKIRDLVVAAQGAPTESARRIKMDEVVAYFENWVTGRKSYTFRFAGKYCGAFLTRCFCLGKNSGNYLSSVYLIVKLLSLLNVVCNFALLAAFLDLNFWKYGLVVINAVMQAGDWQDPYNFPRLLICDFVVESDDGGGTSGAQNKTPSVFHLQCTMNVNFLLEKVFVVEWFWLVFLFVVTLVNLVSWTIRVKRPFSVIYFLKSYARPLRTYESVEKGFMSALAGSVEGLSGPGSPSKKEFVLGYLKSDGVFVLQMLELNGDRSLVEDIVQHLWKRYRATRRPPIDPESIECGLKRDDGVGVSNMSITGDDDQSVISDSELEKPDFGKGDIELQHLSTKQEMGEENENRNSHKEADVPVDGTKDISLNL